jgi:glutaminyl-peptide cyclotransferase
MAMEASEMEKHKTMDSHNKPVNDGKGRSWLSRRMLAIVTLACCLAVTGWFFILNSQNGNAAPDASRLKLEDIPFDGTQAYDYLKKLCDIGPRPSGSQGMATQQKLLEKHFKDFGGQVTYQRFRVKHPINGAWVPMANMLIRWNPQSERRILFCAHYDTLPYPLRDPQNPRGRFVGANDNASGVAILMQLAHEMSSLKNNPGVDFLLLDGEEFIFEEGDPMFLGAEYFAQEYVKEKQEKDSKGYSWAILLDMVGDAQLQILQDRESVRWDDTRPLVREIWAQAAKLGVREFVARPMRQIYFTDDHITLHNLGKIPCIDVIDFEYPAPPKHDEMESPYWHTEADTPDKCSALSLAKVGWVMLEWLKSK